MTGPWGNFAHKVYTILSCNGIETSTKNHAVVLHFLVLFLTLLFRTEHWSCVFTRIDKLYWVEKFKVLTNSTVDKLIHTCQIYYLHLLFFTDILLPWGIDESFKVTDVVSKGIHKCAEKHFLWPHIAWDCQRHTQHIECKHTQWHQVFKCRK